MAPELLLLFGIITILINKLKMFATYSDMEEELGFTIPKQQFGHRTITNK